MKQSLRKTFFWMYIALVGWFFIQAAQAHSIVQLLFAAGMVCGALQDLISPNRSLNLTLRGLYADFKQRPNPRTPLHRMLSVLMLGFWAAGLAWLFK